MSSPTPPSQVPRSISAASASLTPHETLFGIPMGDLGWFASLLIGTATGFAAFFAATFLSIIALLVYNTATHRAIDYSYTYKRVGLPIGLLVLVTAYLYLATLWSRRKLRGA